MTAPQQGGQAETDRDGSSVPHQLSGESATNGTTQQNSAIPTVHIREVRQGHKPGERYVRIHRPFHEGFRETSGDTLVARDQVFAPRSTSGRVFADMRRILFGKPLATAQLAHERLSKTKALAVFSSDALSSSAYATEEILRILVLAGAGALSLTLPVAGAIGVPRLLQRLFVSGQAPPNAAINAQVPGRGQLLMGVRLGAPRFDPRARTLRFRVHSLVQSPRTRIRGRTDVVLPRRFGRVALFIDNCCPGGLGGPSSPVAVLNTSALALTVSVNNGAQFTIAGTDRSIGIMELASRLRDSKMPEGVPSSLDVDHTTKGVPSTFPNGCHVAEVEIDPDTGVVQIVRYNGVNDFGTVVNPMIVAGQIHGGVAQGIGQALMECVTYDDSGQPVTGSFMDYALPRAEDIPSMTLSNHPSPATSNPLGTKGCGEAGCAGSLATIVNAVLDALSDEGVTSIDMPLTPEKVWRAIQDGRKAKSA